MSTQSESIISPKTQESLLKIFPGGVVFFDLETTGLSPLFDRVIEFAGIKILRGQSPVTLSMLVKPDIEISPENSAIHGITNEDVADCEGETIAAPKIKEFIGELPVVAHNSKFDIGFLMATYHRCGIETDNNSVYCSCNLSRKLNKEAKSHRLSALCEQFDINLENHHRALDDTIACLKVFNAVCEMSRDIRAIGHSSLLYQSGEFKKAFDKLMPEKLKDLEGYCTKRTPVEIKYKGGKKKNSVRKIIPFSLLPLPTGIALYGKCQATSLFKYYKIEKITEMNVQQLDKAQEED